MELFRILAGRRTVHKTDRRQPPGREARWIALGLGLVSAVLPIVGCRHHSNGPTSEIRIIDTVADADMIDVYVSRKENFGEATYGMATNYSKIPCGSYSVEVEAQRGRKVVNSLAPFQLDAEQDHHYTGIVVGNALSWPHAKVIVFDDPANSPSDEQRASLRVVDAYPHSMKLDVIINNIVAFKSLAFGSQSNIIQVPAGDCVAKTLPAGTYGDLLAGPTPVRLEAGKSYLLVVMGPDTPTQPGIVAVCDN